MSPAALHRARFTVAAFVSLAFAWWATSADAGRTLMQIVWLYIATGARG